jgi:hypothetical protein
MAAVSLATLVLQISVIYLPFLNRFFGLTLLPIKDVGIARSGGIDLGRSTT